MNNLGFVVHLLPVSIDDAVRLDESPQIYVCRMVEEENHAARYGRCRASVALPIGETSSCARAVCVAKDSECNTLLNEGMITFAPLSEAEIAAYISCVEPADKAGAYAILGMGGVFVVH